MVATTVTAKVSKGAARATSARQVRDARLEGSRLVVLQRGASRLAWETTVDGVRHGDASRLPVYVDALSGKVLSTKEHVAEGTGSSAYAGSVSLPTTLSGSTYSMKNANAATLVCQDAATNVTFSGTDDLPRTGQTIHLHATDPELADVEGAGEWLITLAPEGLTVTHEHSKGDVAVRGPVSDLLLLLWNRRDTEGLQVFGDESVLDDWRAHVTV